MEEEDREQNSEEDSSEEEKSSEDEEKKEQARIEAEARKEKIRRKLERRQKQRKEEERQRKKYLAKMKSLGGISEMDEEHTSRNRNLSFAEQVKMQRKKNESEKAHDKNLRIHRAPGGAAEMTFVPKSHRHKSRSRDGDSEQMSGKKKQIYEGRRRASKNTFRGM